MEWYQVATIALWIFYGVTIAILIYFCRRNEEMIYVSHFTHEENIIELKNRILKLEESINDTEALKAKINILEKEIDDLNFDISELKRYNKPKRKILNEVIE